MSATQQLPKSISDGFIFKLYDETLDLKGKMVNLLSKGDVVQLEDLEEYINMFDRRYMFPLKTKAIANYKAGNIILLYDPIQSNPLPPPIPCFMSQNKDRQFIIGNITNYAKRNKSNGSYIIDAKKLYALIESSYVIGLSYAKHNALVNKTSIIKDSLAIYVKLFNKVIKKIFSLSISEYMCNSLDYVVGWFFLYNLMGRTNPHQQEFNKKYALDNLVDSSGLGVDNVINTFIPEEDFKNLSTFITALSRKFECLKKLTPRVFIDQYLLNYGTTMLLAIEYLPYLYMNMCFVQTGSFLNNQHIIEGLCKNEISALIKELAKL